VPFNLRSRLDGKTVLVTGATGGIGLAHTKAFVEAGAKVFAHARQRLHQLDELEKSSGAMGVIKDLGTPEDCRELVREVVKADGKLDVLIANHATMSMGPMVDADPEQWWRVIDTNLLGTYALIQEAVRVMRSQKTGGRVVVIVSEWGVIGWPEATAYAATKAGLISLVKCLGRELAPEGIYVNAIAPGVIDTPQLNVDADAAGISLTEMHRVYANQIPLGRIGKPEEIAEAAVFLAMDELRSMAGQTLQINGGSTRGRV
jgi:NAD(P)-dependent dehydrogenase (short-subunit alcohol dehydrogenase family)